MGIYTQLTGAARPVMEGSSVVTRVTGSSVKVVTMEVELEATKCCPPFGTDVRVSGKSGPAARVTHFAVDKGTADMNADGVLVRSKFRGVGGGCYIVTTGAYIARGGIAVAFDAPRRVTALGLVGKVAFSQSCGGTVVRVIRACSTLSGRYSGLGTTSRGWPLLAGP